MTSAAPKPIPTVKTAGRARRPSKAEPIVVYVAGSLDGTTFTLDAMSQRRIREAFPGVHVSTRHVYISHDTHEAFARGIGRFEAQVIPLLTGWASSRAR